MAETIPSMLNLGFGVQVFDINPLEPITPRLFIIVSPPYIFWCNFFCVLLPSKMHEIFLTFDLIINIFYFVS